MNHFHLYKRCLRVLVGLMLVSVPVASLAEGYLVVQGGSLNLRQEASLDAGILGQYPTGTWMYVVEKGDEWSKVTVNGKEGYVMSKYLTDAASGSKMYVRTNTGRGLNLRDAPSTSGNIISSFVPGTAVDVTIRGNNGWYGVEVKGQNGYMASEYLSASATGGGSSTTGYPKQGVVKNPGVNQVLLLRETASTNARVLGYFGNGTAVTLHGTSGDFYKVTVNGVNGYMMQKYISVTSTGGGSTTVPTDPFKAKLVNPNGNSIVNFRSGASLSASIIKSYPVGTEITVTELGDVWCKVTIDGQEGYVSRYFFETIDLKN